MSIYSVVKKIADAKEISIYKIERDLNITNGSINKWNRSMPGADKLQLVADYLGVTTAFILNKSKED
ncbi:XRE family transcriptional regulator [Levilactobacillus brevis]|uniref:XRE family transcriptional regulator n=1 Tax=Levilactobacillus brevis TaxID=1580 RepID=UPI003F4AC5A4